MPFARKVEFTIRSGQERQFKTVFQTKILPILQKQKGFQDELVLTHGRDATAISLWDTRGSAEAYEEATYPKIVETLRTMIDGTPQVDPCEVVITTVHAHAAL
jgi:hypothetical protein